MSEARAKELEDARRDVKAIASRHRGAHRNVNDTIGEVLAAIDERAALLRKADGGET